METLLHLLVGGKGKRGPAGLWGGLCASPHPISPLSSSSPPSPRGRWTTSCLGQEVGGVWQRREGCFHQQSIAPLVLDQFPEAK